MHSVTKNRQSMNVLRQMATRAYGADRVPSGDGWVHELNEGLFNAAYLVQLDDGYRAVVKIAPPPDVEMMTYERGAMATELATIELIRQQTTVPVPSVDFVDQSHDLGGADYFFMSYIDGDNLSVIKDQLARDEQRAYAEALGAATRQINSVLGTQFGPVDGSRTDSWRDTFAGMVGDVLVDGRRRGVDLGWDYGAIEAILVDNLGCLDEVTQPCLVEWDLWDGNVMVKDGRISGILDHERAFFGDPIMEHGFNGVELPAFGDPTGFLHGYGKISLSREERRRRQLYCLHLSLIMIIETDYRELSDPQPYEWARQRLTETVAMLRGPR